MTEFYTLKGMSSLLLECNIAKLSIFNNRIKNYKHVILNLINPIFENYTASCFIFWNLAEYEIVVEYNEGDDTILNSCTQNIHTFFALTRLQ